MKYQIPHTLPWIGSVEHECVASCLDSRMLNEGIIAERLTKAVCDCAATSGGVPASTGTAALHLALLASGITPESNEILIPEFSCKCLWDAILLAGGIPRLVDIAPDGFTFLPEAAKEKVSNRTHAIIIPHMYGYPVDIEPFKELGLTIIEDCAHAIGASIQGRTVGSNGDFAIFSFEGSKLLGAGEGGVAAARLEENVAILRDLRYGTDTLPAYPYRLSDLQASVVEAQFSKLRLILEKRRRIAEHYISKLSHFQSQNRITIPIVAENDVATYYRFVIRCSFPTAALIKKCNRDGIMVRPPLPGGGLSRLFPKLNEAFPYSRRLAQCGLSLPIHPEMNEEKIDRVLSAISHTIGKSDTL